MARSHRHSGYSRRQVVMPCGSSSSTMPCAASSSRMRSDSAQSLFFRASVCTSIEGCRSGPCPRRLYNPPTEGIDSNSVGAASAAKEFSLPSRLKPLPQKIYCFSPAAYRGHGPLSPAQRLFPPPGGDALRVIFQHDALRGQFVTDAVGFGPVLVFAGFGTRLNQGLDFRF